MKQDRWTAVDEYFQEQLAPHDDVLDATQQACAQAGLPDIAVAPNQGKLLQLLARMIDARTILEIGTLGGYSTIWLARALPDRGTAHHARSRRHPRGRGQEQQRAGRPVRPGGRPCGRALDLLPHCGTKDRSTWRSSTRTRVNNPHYVRWALEPAGRAV